MLLEGTYAVPWEYSIPEDSWDYVAPQVEEILGYTPQEWTDYNFWLERLHPEDRTWASEYCDACTSRGEAHTFEYRFRARDGHYVWLRDVVSIEMKDNQPVRLRGFMIDISNRREAELKAQELLEEKELLLREIHHRVKNNMSMISAFLNLQADDTDNPHSASVLLEAAQRVTGMATLYDSLFHSSDLRATSVDSYLQTLIHAIIEGYPEKNRKIHADITVEDSNMKADLLISLGIIVNELVTNTLKYAFHENRPGRLEVSFHSDDQKARLEVRDNGPGLPPGFSLDSSEGFGLKLVKLLSTQLQGKLMIENRNGAGFILEFPLAPAGQDR